MILQIMIARSVDPAKIDIRSFHGLLENLLRGYINHSKLVFFASVLTSFAGFRSDMGLNP